MNHETALCEAQDVGAGNIASASLLQRRLRRFPNQVRGAVTALADRHSRIADLAISFPALLFALAVPRRGFDREKVIRRVIAGACLKELGKCAGVPLWLRNLPPESLVRPLPLLPDDGDFRRQIANHLPRSPRLIASWLDAIATANDWGAERLAIWIAREYANDPRNVKLEALRCICLWSWFSGQPGSQGHLLVEKPWTPAMSFDPAIRAAQDWHERARLYCSLGDKPIADMWLTAGSVDGYDFAPIRTTREIIDEANVMQHCVVNHGYLLAHNRSRLWSMRKNGRRVATVEVNYRYGDPLPNIAQLSGTKNQQCPTDAWWAARRWLQSHDLPQIGRNEIAAGKVPFDRACWIALWQPYWLAKRRLPSWLPIAPSKRALGALHPRHW